MTVSGSEPRPDIKSLSHNLHIILHHSGWPLLERLLPRYMLSHKVAQFHSRYRSTTRCLFKLNWICLLETLCKRALIPSPPPLPTPVTLVSHRTKHLPLPQGSPSGIKLITLMLVFSRIKTISHLYPCPSFRKSSRPFLSLSHCSGHAQV